MTNSIEARKSIVCVCFQKSKQFVGEEETEDELAQLPWTGNRGQMLCYRNCALLTFQWRGSELRFSGSVLAERRMDLRWGRRVC